MPTPALLAGYRRFRAEVWPERRALFERLASEGQQPPALVIACSDSRVDPAMIFGTAPGTLFIVRNVAALVPPYAPDTAYHGTSAAIEYAVTVLNVPDVIVLGHGMCGGIAAGGTGRVHRAVDRTGPSRRRARARLHAGRGGAGCVRARGDQALA
jgi:carbonic anhydrase